MNIDLNEQFFWELIEQSNTSDSWETYDIDEHIDELTALLTELSSDEMILFEMTLRKKINELDKVEIGELGVILENSFQEEDGIYNFDDHISTDGFIYFRCWLILRGKEFFYDIIKDINAFISGKYSFDIGDTWGEGLLYVSDLAYDAKYGTEDSSFVTDAVNELYQDIEHYDVIDTQWTRPPYTGTALQTHYPALVKEIGELRREE
ncbi:DUF4240 domain-containing protein [Myroides odoratimimus]|uniref:DUF4240 domain-containing protein n=1 Tax=Myroides odoratimimus TaxID=76832 RepID=UPI002575E6A6|nr:DUF4240 domain-containing protein [Myroides odoratimimus]MDM1066200.1 DUF4240 domain-containing protein [Myroides odoratimimus]MDM1401570.1 DUF4240 domain-containing protein [Myroides odoratimimus]